MNQKYANVLALQLAVYEAHDHGYNPIEKIIDFWRKYDINTLQNSFDTILKNASSYKKSGNVLQLCHRQVFAADVLRVLIAYFHVHIGHINMQQVDISGAETTLSSLEELEITKRIHHFFSESINQ